MFPTLDLEEDQKGEPLIQMTTFPSCSSRPGKEKGNNFRL